MVIGLVTTNPKFYIEVELSELYIFHLTSKVNSEVPSETICLTTV